MMTVTSFGWHLALNETQPQEGKGHQLVSGHMHKARKEIRDLAKGRLLRRTC